MNVTELRKKRAAAIDKLEALVAKDSLTVEEKRSFDALEREVKECDTEIERTQSGQAAAAATAQPVAGQDPGLSIQAGDDDIYSSESAAKARGLKTHLGLRAVACAKLFHAAGRNVRAAMELASETYGERHSITRGLQPRHDPKSRALVASVGADGGFLVPPDYVNEIIQLLRPKAVVRSSGPRVLPMPRGTMTMPKQTSAASASYGTETQKIASTQQAVGQVVASYKKLRALVPVSNDMMRYADPAADAFVRDDLVKVMALREDLAFLTGDGTGASPMGFTAFANRFAVNSGGTAGSWSSTADSTLASGGNFLTSNEAYDLATAAQELGGLSNVLDTQNVLEQSRVWFGHPRTFNYLYNVQNSLGVYVYREEMEGGKLLGYPFKKSTQIPINLYDATAAHTDCSFLMLTEMDEAMILDSMTLELAVSLEGTYVDSGGNTVSAFQSDETIIRAISEHDFQMRHDAAVAVLQNVRWAPAIA